MLCFLPRLLGFVVLLSAGSVLAQTVPPPPPPPPPPLTKEFDYVLVTTEMPLFPGCDESDYAERKICAEKKMMEFIYGNIKLTESALKSSPHGTVIVSFIVERNGGVSSVEVIRKIGFGLDEEVVRVINLMNEKGLKFEPGKSGGRQQRVKYTIPVNFKATQ